MLSILFNIIIFPIYTLIEVLFGTFYKFTNTNVVLSIFAISIIVNFLCLPLYLNADRLQHEEKDIQEKLKKKIDSIKKNFKGDEKHMLLQTYYRQNNYHPIMSLRLSFSLLLQIPFFIGAYLFFSHLSLLSGFPFGIIEDLSKPDQLIHIGNFRINFLPIFMTIVNIFAGYIYTKNLSTKDKIQLWIMSLVFLVLLYNSPSALVIYWTYNNIFSLFKNIGLMSKNPKEFLINSLFFIFLLTYIIFKKYYVSLDTLLFILLLIILNNKFHFHKINFNFNPKPLYILSMIGLIILYGLMIPSNVTATSPVEFVVNSDTSVVFTNIFKAFIKYIGLFAFWGMVFYTFSTKQGKKILSVFAFTAILSSLFNMFYAKLPLETMYSDLSFYSNVHFYYKFTSSDFICCTFFCIMLISIAVLIYKKQSKFIKNCAIIIVITMFIKTGINFGNIYSVLKKYNSMTTNSTNLEKIIHFSKTEENVLIIFLDRFVSSYIPIIFSKYPQLKQDFSGFVYYPNIVSPMGHTILSYPALMGGYEYNPIDMYLSDKTLKEQYIEASLLMPEIFKKEGWNTTVTDSPFAGFDDNCTNSKVFRDKGINYIHLRGKYNELYIKKEKELLQSPTINDNSLNKQKDKNFFFFSFLQTSIPYLRNDIYEYMTLNVLMEQRALDDYAALLYLPSITDFSSTKKSFVVINNELPHNEQYLTYPEFKVPTTKNQTKGNTLIDADELSNKAYSVCTASIMLVDKYLNFLKENNIYDNTKILIISDHGSMYAINPNFNDFENQYVMPFNPLLLVKDFNKKDPITVNNEFMQNADVPYLIMNNTVKNPINPYSGKTINKPNKINGAYILPYHDARWSPSAFENNKILQRNDTIHFVEKDIKDQKNWKTNVPYIEILSNNKSLFFNHF